MLLHTEVERMVQFPVEKHINVIVACGPGLGVGQPGSNMTIPSGGGVCREGGFIDEILALEPAELYLLALLQVQVVDRDVQVVCRVEDVRGADWLVLWGHVTTGDPLFQAWLSGTRAEAELAGQDGQDHN